MKTLKLEQNLSCAWDGWARWSGRIGYSLVTYLVDFVGSGSVFKVRPIFCLLRFAHLDWSGPDRFCKHSRFGSGPVNHSAVYSRTILFVDNLGLSYDTLYGTTANSKPFGL